MANDKDVDINAQASSEQLDPKFLDRLMPEIVEEIGVHMVGDSTRVTGSRMDDFRTFSPYARAVADTSPQLKRVQKRIKDTRSFQTDLQKAILADDGSLPPHQQFTYDMPPEMEPVSAVARVRAMRPLLKDMSTDEISKFTSMILEIPNTWARSECAYELMPHFDDIPKNHQSRLIQDQIDIFGSRGEHPLTQSDYGAFGAEGFPLNIEGRDNAADVIVECRARNFLTNDHKSNILDHTINWPELGGLLAERELRRRESLSTQIRMFGPNVAAGDVLKSDDSPSKVSKISQLISHFNEIDPTIRSGLIDNALKALDDDNAHDEVISKAIDVIVEGKAGKHLTKEHKIELQRLQNEYTDLAEVLSERLDTREKYAIKQASDVEMANLRKTFNEIRNVNVPA